MIDICVIGSGPAGLMAADVASAAGKSVLIVDAKPSFGRKFLMAGKSGLNLTKAEPLSQFIEAYDESENWLGPIISKFGPIDVQHWAQSLGQTVFTGSSGRVFPKTMKASPLLRAWLAKLTDAGVQFQTRWRWMGWENQSLLFETPNGPQTIQSKTCILALGGGSWAKLGSDGLWTALLNEQGIQTTDFVPSNMGFCVRWSKFMKPHFGAPIKTVKLFAGPHSTKGDFVISSYGVEGSAIYAVSKYLRLGATLSVDLLPDITIQKLEERISKLPKKSSRSSILRKALKLDAAKSALVNEFGRTVTGIKLAQFAKNLPVPIDGPRPIDEAISTGGGVAQCELSDDLMLKQKPGIFCAGEMLDWEAPTGGYLITACLATGAHAARGALKYLNTP